MAGVGVVVPLYNLGAHVDRCLESLASQTLRDWTAVVIDDGSTDDGPDRVAHHARRDPRIRLLRQPNAGVSAARNRGLDELDRLASPSADTFLLLLDPDDTLAPDAMEVLSGAARAAGAPAALGDFRLVDTRGRRLADHAGRTPRVGLDELLGSVFMLISGHVVRRDAWQGQRFDPSLGLIEDTDLWLRLGERGVWWTCVRRVVTWYTIRPDSRSARHAQMLSDTEQVYRRAYARVRAAGLDADTSEARLAGVLARAALNYSARALLAGASLHTAGAMLARHAHGGARAGFRPDAPFLIRTARRAAVMALALDPDDPEDHPRWAPAASRWLQLLAARGWVDAREADRALEALESPADAIHPSGPPPLSPARPQP
jgi:glycosyltransferase involved in cell wall biosynthesis